MNYTFGDQQIMKLKVPFQEVTLDNTASSTKNAWVNETKPLKRINNSSLHGQENVW